MRPFCVPALLATALCSIALCSPAQLWAQEAPSPDAPPVSTAPDTSNLDQQPPTTTLKVNVNLVSLFFTARDKRGALIPNLTQNECQVFEDKQLQKVKNFSPETDLPLTLGIMLDTSGSQQNVLQMEQQTGDSFVKRILRDKDQAFLISFDVQVSLLQDFTSNPRLIAKAMDQAEINTAGGNGSAGIPGIGQGPMPTQGAPKGTLLYDAVYQVSNDKLRSETGRKALIILTDGEDEGSREKLADAVEAAQKANAIIYVLLIADRGFYSGGGMINLGGFTGDSAMRKMAEDTGGRMIDVGNNGKKMEAAFAQIEEELRTQYLASYTPTNTRLDGSYRKVDVFCKHNNENLKIQARKGYYAIAPDDSGQ
ncbi:VWA domain-containing protein [Acidipila rosea]|uniref:VWFA-related protein n=1 Tax=Acidipila rosea TaxID=768535 RepID=A0A4R1L1I3_9BACT|nr:VWA domain-containing protein [Acidipila rosea]MBW4027771.1 VWA domain-containing protein [Acidobacteriota bacterium]MBW4045499.1 VWA domain-containing protein [Acidobacteriota bacterium]TCK70780.1 VWFA-related protein [Acidipila rosea]